MHLENLQNSTQDLHVILHMTKIWRIYETAHMTCMSFSKPIIVDRINSKVYTIMKIMSS